MNKEKNTLFYASRVEEINGLLLDLYRWGESYEFNIRNEYRWLCGKFLMLLFSRNI
jgi:hypothetical protein